MLMGGREAAGTGLRGRPPAVGGALLRRRERL